MNYVGRRSKRVRELPGAETGRAETSEEFAARMKDWFTLKGPKEVPPKEKLVIWIKRSKTTQPTDTLIPVDQNVDISNDNTPDQVVEDVSPTLDIAEALDGIDIIKDLKGNYSRDATFKSIVEKPADYKNFKFDVAKGVLYLKQDSRQLLCIPDIMVNGRKIREIIIAEYRSGSLRIQENIRVFAQLCVVENNGRRYWKVLFFLHHL